jgi:hypothetical protein
MGEKKNDKFVGIISVHEWNGKPKHAFAFNQNGNVALMQETNVFFRKASLRNSALCYDVYYTYVDVRPDENGLYDVEVIGYTRTNCIFTNDVEIRDRGPEDFGSGGDSGGGGYSGVDPYQYSDNIDCAGVAGGTAIFSDECQTCIGGATGIDRCDPLDIINKVTDPCLRPLVESLINNNVSGKISEIISKLNGDTKVKVTFTDVENTVLGGKGETGPSVKDKQGVWNIPIKLNRSLLKDSSKEYTTAVIIHEVIHAYFITVGKASEFSSFEHEIMATDYVKPFASYLTAIYGISEKHSISLAWAGITNSASYKKTDAIFKYSDGYMIKDTVERIATDYSLPRYWGSLGQPICN